MSQGRWADAVTPKRGWFCLSVYDNGTPDVECGMCEDQMCRYVHVMNHPRFDDQIEVGCICAGYMEGWFDGGGEAKNREKVLRNRATRRSKWLTRQWKLTAKGNPKVKVDGQTIAIFRAGNMYSFIIDGVRSQSNFQSENDAKYGAFDYLFPARIDV